MLVVEKNTTFHNWSQGNPVHPMDYGGEVVIAFDPSKTNMAMVIGTPDGDVLNVLEFSGNNRKKGPVMDTTDYCQEVRSFLSQYLSNVSIYMVGLEQAIQKKGNEFYRSSMVLTEIRGNLLNFFQEQFDVKPIEINNWSWKFGVLPDGYRGKYEKGSKKWFLRNMPNSPYAQYYEADVTDCLCIYWYMVNKMCKNYVCYCNRYENCRLSYATLLLPENSQVTSKFREVIYNPTFSIEENLNYYVNRIMGTFFMKVPENAIPMEMIYGKCSSFLVNDIGCENVKVVVARQ